jgi:LuxR family quorum-sensing system transcriptional regulator CciR
MHFDFDRHVRALSSAATDDDLHDHLETLTRELGFSRFALGHNIDLCRPPTDAIRVTNYPEGWVERVAEQGYLQDDPIHKASMRRAAAFLWHDAVRTLPLTERQDRILAEAAGFGLRAGMTVPVHVPGEYYGGCSFGAPSLDGLRTNALHLAQMAATLAFEAARRLMQRRDGRAPPPPPRLTPRMRETLIWVGRAKTDSEISAVMRISKATAHEHVENLRRAYGHAQRTQLIVRALFDGQVTFADLLRR